MKPYPHIIIILAVLISPLAIAAESWIKYSYFQEKYNEPKPMKQTDLIFLGDSLIDWHNWRLFGSHYNAGIAGDTTDGILYRIHTIQQRKPHTVILMIGVNDLLSGISLEEVKRNYSRILDALSGIKQLIILSTLPVADMYQADQINKDVISLNVFLKNEVKKRKLYYIDLHSSFVGNHSEIQQQYTIDGVHLSNQGYLLWEKILSKEFPADIPK